MSVSYKKLWKLLIDKEMKKKELCAKAGISTSSLTKMGKNGHVTTEVLAKICRALDCTVDDIMEVIPEQPCAHPQGVQTLQETDQVRCNYGDSIMAARIRA